MAAVVVPDEGTVWFMPAMGRVLLVMPLLVLMVGVLAWLALPMKAEDQLMQVETKEYHSL